jgi:hypothetical protein
LIAVMTEANVSDKGLAKRMQDTLITRLRYGTATPARPGPTAVTRT